MGVSPGIGGLIAGRALTGFAASVWVLLVVAFSSLFPPEEAVRAAAILPAVNAVSRMLVTASTGALNDIGGYPLAFFFAAGTACLAIMVMLVYQGRTPATQTAFCQRCHPANYPARCACVLPCSVPFCNMRSGHRRLVFRPIWRVIWGHRMSRLGLMVSMNIGLVMLGNLLQPPCPNAWVAYPGCRHVFTGIRRIGFAVAQPGSMDGLCRADLHGSGKRDWLSSIDGDEYPLCG